MRFAGARVAIGGAGQGVGAACARLFAAQGASLALCARSASDLAALASSLRQIQRDARPAGSDAADAEIVCIPTDLGTDAGAELFARCAHERLGGVDLGLICAGVALRPGRLVEGGRGPAEAEPSLQALLQEQLQGGTIAPALAAIALARHWRERAAPPALAPQLLVLSSLVTRRPALEGTGPYLAAKCALEALVRTLAEESWPRVRVNALSLGPVQTRLHTRAGTPPEVIAQFPTADEIAMLVLRLVAQLETRGASPGLSGRCIDAEAFALDPAAALWGDGRLAPLHPLQGPPDAASEEDGAPQEAEPGRAPSPRVRRALRETAASLQRYPTDLHRLTRRLAELHRVEPESILLSGGGATALLERALCAVGQSGDEVVSPFPTFEVLSALASRAGLRHRPVLAQRAPDGTFLPHRARELLAALGPRTRAVYVATPDNPTGATLPPEEEAALRAGLGAQIALILDEAWSLDVPDEARAASHPRAPFVGTQTIPPACPLLRLRSLSKLHGLAGLRVGYAIASPGLASLIRRLELPFPLGAPQIAAALAALDDLPRARRIALLLRRERDRLARGIRALGLLASEGASPLVLVRDPRPGASAGPLLFALRMARVAAQEAHWDPAALTLPVGGPAQDRRALAALARAAG